MRKVILLMILCISHCVFAQQNGVKVKVFDADEVETQNNTQKTPYLGDLNFIKINPYLLLRGAFTVGYERVLHPKHAVEINGGLTYRDFIYEKWELLDSDYESTTKIGQIVDLSYKFYPKFYNNFEGLYVSPGFLARKYNIEKNVDYNYSRSSKLIPNGYSMKEMYLKFGYVYESWWFDDLLIDTYCGIGMREIKKQDYEIVDGINGNSETIRTFISKTSLPSIYLGIKMGWSF